MSGVQRLFAPFLIGAFANTILYGIFLIQSFIYFRTYRKDAARLRYLVLFLILCDTLHTVVDIGIVYEPLVFRYGTARATERVPIMLPFDPLLNTIISTSVQSFICWRIKTITNSWIIPGFIGIFVFCSFVGGVATCICGLIFVEFSQLTKIDGAVITWLTSSAIADISITISLVVSLAKRRTGNERTDNAIDRIIRLTIHTGAVTAVFATLNMVLFVAIPGSTFNFAFDFPLAKLYTNSLLSTLNARGGYDNAQQRPNNNILFGASSWSTSHASTESNNGRKTDKYTHIQTSHIPSNVIELSSLPPARHQQQDGQTFSNIDLESAGSDANDMTGDTSSKFELCRD